MRAALYARFSTENQNAASVADQLRLCREYAERIGAHVVREFSDEEITGTIDARPGFHALMTFARGLGCDVVIAEHSDRLHRGGSGGWNVFETLQDLGIAYRTVMEDEVTALKQSVSTLISTHKIEEVRHRTRRGLKGRVEAGRSAGGLSYGYRKKRLYDAAGEPVRGHLEIDPHQAEVVRAIFRDFAAGTGPKAIVTALNAKGEPAPRGGLWSVSTILGNAARGNGIIHNALYAGVRVWGRQTFVKDRATGARRGRPAPGPATRQDVPDLRIVEPALWDAVQARYAAAARQAARPGGAGHARRPKRFLQGLIVCSLCGGTMQRAGPKEALRCATRIAKGACANTRTPGYRAIEARVIEALKANLLRPDAIELAIREVQQAMLAGQQDAARRRARQEAELAELKRRQARLIDQLEEGVPWAALKDRHAELEAKATAIAGELAETADVPAEVVTLPKAAASYYRALVEDLAAALDNPDDVALKEGREAVRALIDRILFIPAEGFNRYELAIEGDLAPLLLLGANEKAPAGAGAYRQSQGRLGAGTRFTRSHTLSLPFRQVA